jgi:hypothetical protein
MTSIALSTRPLPMSTPDPVLAAYREADTVLLSARPDQLHEALRILACDVAHCRRYGEALPLSEMVQRISAANRDPASAALVSEGLGHLVEVLRLLNVAPTAPDAAGHCEALRADLPDPLAGRIP